MKTQSTPARAVLAINLAAMLAAAPVAFAQQPATPQKKLYCWNDHGHKVCGDALPPEQAAQARREFSARSGRTVGEVARAPTPEERLAAETAAGEAQRTAETETARARRDQAMAQSYETEADLQRAFNARIALVDASIKTSVLGEANLRRSLAGLLNQAANLELTGKPVPKPLQDNILAMHAELGRQLQVLRQQRADRGTLDGDLATALQRYRELRTPLAQSAP